MVTQRHLHAIEAARAKQHTLRHFFLGLFWVAALLPIKPVHAAGTVPASMQYACGAIIVATAIDAEMCFYNAWIGAYRMTGCAFNQLTWYDMPTQLNGYIPFSPTCGYGHVLPVMLPKIAGCPAHSTNTGGGYCTCDTNYKPDAAGKSCVSECPVPELLPLPAGDLCAQSLEAGLGVDVNGACPQPSAALTNQLQCFSNKVAATNATARPPIPYSGPTATIRNVAYQAHLQNIWDKLIELDNLTDSVQIEACQPLHDKVLAEKGCSGGHCINYRPVDFSNHSTGTAFDISKNSINGLLRELTPLPPAPMTLQQSQQFQQSIIAGWLSSPTSCSLIWGGSFQDPDIVHFQLP